MRHGDAEKEVARGVDAGHFPCPVARTIFERIDAAEIAPVFLTEIDAGIRRADGETEETQLRADLRASEREHVLASGNPGRAGIGEGRTAIGGDEQAGIGTEVDVVAIKKRATDQHAIDGIHGDVDLAEARAAVGGNIEHVIAGDDHAAGVVVVGPDTINIVSRQRTAGKNGPSDAAIGGFGRLGIVAARIGDGVGDQRIAGEPHGGFMAGLDIDGIDQRITVAEIGGAVEPAHVTRDEVFVVVGRIDRGRVECAATADTAGFPRRRHLGMERGQPEGNERKKNKEKRSNHGREGFVNERTIAAIERRGRQWFPLAGFSPRVYGGKQAASR